ncbi:hypothetical protein EIP86_009982 [Pleurotus ostreatoroseus]|nr:hypothetical protein EIP86_009982 [Pleurotus ostreatoroseus]
MDQKAICKRIEQIFLLVKPLDSHDGSDSNGVERRLAVRDFLSHLIQLQPSNQPDSHVLERALSSLFPDEKEELTALQVYDRVATAAAAAGQVENDVPRDMPASPFAATPGECLSHTRDLEADDCEADSLSDSSSDGIDIIDKAVYDLEMRTEKYLDVNETTEARMRRMEKRIVGTS